MMPFMTNTTLDDLFAMAKEVAPKAYAPYSNFHVGAALLCEDGTIITGVNVENRSFGLTNCAERTALYTARTMGKTSFSAIAIATPDADYPVSPCGACRQVISEFLKPDTPVTFGSNDENRINTSVKELFPFDALHELKKN